MTLAMPPLLALLRQLLSPDQAQQAERLAASLSPQALLETLANQGVLTSYQVAEIGAGRGAGLLIGSYVLLEKLGAGGMGEVFRACNRDLEREEALKRLLPAMLELPDLVARFKREVKAAARLSHPNVVQVFAGGEADGVHYLAMELLRGVNLAQYLAKRGPLPVAEAMEYVRQACVGMQHVHEQGIVHRDLKPSNLWLTQQRQVKILDLGLALVTHASTMTQAGGFFGSVDYVAPEQVTDSHHVDIRADVYSLGCTLYHLLAGKTPFGHAPLAVRPFMHGREQAPPIEGLCPNVSPELANVLQTMMAPTPQQRHQTPAEAAAALAACGNGTKAPLLRTAVPGSIAPPAQPWPVTETPSTDAVPGAKVVPAAVKPLGMRGTLLAGLIVGAMLLILGCLTAVFVPTLLSGDRDDDKDKPPTDKDGGTKAATSPLNEKGENSIGIRFVKIPRGKFMMGSADEKEIQIPDKELKENRILDKEDIEDLAGEDDLRFVQDREPRRDDPKGPPRARQDEMPRHEVEISRDFYLGVHEVTQKQYRTIMGYNPSFFSHDGKASEKGTYFDLSKPAGGKDKVVDKDTDDFPVENISWDDAQEFIKKLNEREKNSLGNWEYRLPSEAEWEYSCRGGTSSQNYHFGDTFSSKLGNFGELFSDLKRTEKVGTYPANKYGLHDVHGNVLEWCHDWYDEKYYANSPKADPLGPSTPGSWRVQRGGSWASWDWSCRCANRYGTVPNSRDSTVGFRVALVPARK